MVSPQAGTGKKLIEAARHWAGGGREFAPDESVAQALEAIGAPPEVIAQARSQSGSDDFEVFEDNWETLQAFLDLDTSWTLAPLGMGGSVRFGLPSTEIESTLRMLGIRGKARKKLFQNLRMMERAALEVIADSLDH